MTASGAAVRGEHCYHGAGRQPALGPEAEAEKGMQRTAGPWSCDSGCHLEYPSRALLCDVCHSTDILGLFPVVVAERYRMPCAL